MDWLEACLLATVIWFDTYSRVLPVQIDQHIDGFILHFIIY